MKNPSQRGGSCFLVSLADASGYPLALNPADGFETLCTEQAIQNQEPVSLTQMGNTDS